MKKQNLEPQKQIQKGEIRNFMKESVVIKD